MKGSLLNREIVVSIVVMMLLVCLYQSPSYGQVQNNAPDFTPVSDRTPQVRDTIVALVPGVDAAEDVTAAHLSLIRTLDLSDKNIATLKAGDFDGLSALTSLALSKNQLSRLPVGLFSGAVLAGKAGLRGQPVEQSATRKYFFRPLFSAVAESIFQSVEPSPGGSLFGSGFAGSAELILQPSAQFTRRTVFRSLCIEYACPLF